MGLGDHQEPTQKEERQDGLRWVKAQRIWGPRLRSSSLMSVRYLVLHSSTTAQGARQENPEWVTDHDCCY